MKPKQLLAAIVSSAAVASGVLVAAESQAVGCTFAKGAIDSSQNLPHSSFPFKAAVLGGAALAAGAGIFAVRRLAGDRTPEHPEFASTDELIPASEVFDTEASATPKEEVAAEEKEVTLVG